MEEGPDVIHRKSWILILDSCISEDHINFDKRNELEAGQVWMQAHKVGLLYCWGDRILA